MYNCVYKYKYIYVYQFMAELDRGELVARLLAGAAAAEDADTLEARRRRRQRRLRLLLSLHCIFFCFHAIYVCIVYVNSP